MLKVKAYFSIKNSNTRFKGPKTTNKELEMQFGSKNNDIGFREPGYRFTQIDSALAAHKSNR